MGELIQKRNQSYPLSWTRVWVARPSDRSCSQQPGPALGVRAGVRNQESEPRVGPGVRTPSWGERLEQGRRKARNKADTITAASVSAEWLLAWCCCWA